MYCVCYCAHFLFVLFVFASVRKKNNFFLKTNLFVIKNNLIFTQRSFYFVLTYTWILPYYLITFHCSLLTLSKKIKEFKTKKSSFFVFIFYFLFKLKCISKFRISNFFYHQLSPNFYCCLNNILYFVMRKKIVRAYI